MSAPVIAVAPDTTVRAVARLLVERGIGAAPVVEEGDRLVGWLTEADLLRLELHQDPVRHLRPVPAAGPVAPRTAGELMSRAIYAVPQDADVADVARQMLARSITRVPVVNGDRLVGVISRSDLLRVLIRPDEEIARDARALLDEVDPAWGCEVRDGRVVVTAPVEGGVDNVDNDNVDDVETVQRMLWSVAGVVEVLVEDPPETP
jgi:CBS domain-containing protein